MLVFSWISLTLVHRQIISWIRDIRQDHETDDFVSGIMVGDNACFPHGMATLRAQARQ